MKRDCISSYSGDKREKNDISVVSPVYNEQDSVNGLYERIKRSVPSNYKWELIFVDDGSIDKSKELIKNICLRDNRVKAVFFSKNYGHQIALTAGYDFASGGAVITMDSDLQHPPEIIPEMLKLWEEGNDIVFAIRAATDRLGWFKRLTSKYFYLLLRRISDVDLIEGAADFRLLDQRVVYYLRQHREAGRFLRGLISDMGFRRATLNYKEDERKSGRPKYNLWRMIKFALTGLVSFSSFPLKMSIYTGAAISAFSLIYAAWIVYYKITYGAAPGMASVLVGVFFIGGIQLVFIGILGEYLAGVFREVKKRPLYCVSEIIDMEPST